MPKIYRYFSIHKERINLYHYVGKLDKTKHKQKSSEALSQKQVHGMRLLRHEVTPDWSWGGNGVKRPKLLLLPRLCRIVVQTSFLLVL
jgi:hypothetical protein